MPSNYDRDLLPRPLGTNATGQSHHDILLDDHSNNSSPKRQQQPPLSPPLHQPGPQPLRPPLSPNSSNSSHSPPRSIAKDNASSHQYQNNQKPRSPSPQESTLLSFPQLPRIISASNLATSDDGKLNLESSSIDRKLESNNGMMMKNPDNSKGHSKKISWGFTSFANAAIQEEESKLQPGLSLDKLDADGAMANKPGSKGHSKKISWGGISSFPTSRDENLHAGKGADKPLIFGCYERESSSRHFRRGHVRRNTNISDITSPLEDEAENAIIRALEEREWENEDIEDFNFRNSTNMAEEVPGKDRTDLGILSMIPNSVIRALEEEEVANTSDGSSIASSAHTLKSGVQLERRGNHRRIASLRDATTQLKLMQEQVTSQGCKEDGYLKAAAILNTKALDLEEKHGKEDELEKHVHSISFGGDNKIEEAHHDIDKSSNTLPDLSNNSSVRRTMRKKPNHFKKTCKELLKEVAVNYKAYAKVAICCAIFPSLFISAILFYLAGNPLTGYSNNGVVTVDDSSYSWWILFVGARQVLMFCLAKLTEVIMIDIFTLRSRTVLRMFGPMIMLLLIQSRGWPLVLIIWTLWDFAFLFGNRRFAMHWLFYTRSKWLRPCIFTENGVLVGDITNCNPSGSVVYSDIYLRILIGAIALGCAVSLKRVLVGMYQGKKSTERYAPELETLMAKMLIISEVAYLAEEISENANDPQIDSNRERPQELDQASGQDGCESDSESNLNLQNEDFQNSHQSHPESQSRCPPMDNQDSQKAFWESMVRFRADSDDLKSGTIFSSSKGSEAEDQLRAEAEKDTLQTSISGSAKTKLIELVGEWEDPVVSKNATNLINTSIQDILEFRQAILCLDHRTPFGYAFGPARTREKCIESAQNVYERLLLNTRTAGILRFETIALIALDHNGDIIEKKAKRLIRMFRPDRDGKLAGLDFVKSCDKVYKELRTLRAAIINSSQIDRAFEQIVNVLFYFVMITVLLTILKVDPWALFASVSAFLLGFSFMFGPAASKYFEGILLILVQQPFDIGDRIHISDPRNDTISNGSSSWYVEGITLYSTTVRFAETNEVATYSNGSLAATRIINANRSPDAKVYIYIKFTSDVPYEKIMVFKSIIESFVKERPSQWLTMNGFRATRVEADLGFIEYVIVLTHVEKWQKNTAILTSKAEVSSYCLEVQRKLGMRYQAPPLPVNLDTTSILDGPTIFGRDQTNEKEEDFENLDFSALSSFFTKPARKKKQ